MRVLMVHPGPEFSVADCHAGWHEAFIGLGVDVAAINYNDRLGFYADAGRLSKDGEFVKMVDPVGVVRLAAKGIEAACFEFWPDILFVSSCFFIPMDTLEVIRARGIRVVILHTESPYEDDRQVERAQFADINLLNDPTNIDRFPPNTHYFPHAYRPQVHYPGRPKPELVSDHVFVGTAFPSRVEFLEQVDWDGIDVALCGNWMGLSEDSSLRKFVAHDLEACLDNVDTADMYRAARTSANLYRVESERPELEHGWACGPREIEMAACGLWFARQPRPESDDLFPMLPTFDDPAEYGDLIRWALANEEQREDAAARAMSAIADRTFTNSARRLLALVA